MISTPRLLIDPSGRFLAKVGELTVHQIAQGKRNYLPEAENQRLRM